jgi:hypothetical protein
MTATSPPALMTGEKSAALPALTPQARIAIRSGQPDREHAVLEVVGAPGLESVDVRACGRPMGRCACLNGTVRVLRP